MGQVIVDNIDLLEPNLRIPGKKPVGQVKIDWEDNSAPKLFCWLAGTSAYRFLSLTDMKFLNIGGSGRNIGIDQHNQYFSYLTRGEPNGMDVSNVVSTSGSYTFEGIADYPASYSTISGSATNAIYMFDIGTDRFVIGHNGSATLQFYDGAWTDTGYSPFGNGYQHIIFVFDGAAGSATLYVNGVQKYTGLTYTARNFSSTDAKIYRRYATTTAVYNAKNLPLYFYSITDRAINAGEALKRTHHPYQFLIPQ